MAKRKLTDRLFKRVGKAKKRGKRLLILLLVLLALWVLTLIFAPSETTYVQETSAGIPDLELPAHENTDMLVTHPGYTLLYDEQFEQARWVAYYLSRDELYGSYERGDDFRSDPSIPTGSANLEDYKGSGYDRGHLIPAADLSWSEEAMSGSFFLSNMSPQEGSFNRGIWSELEATVRNFADTEGGVYVVTGPVLTDGPYKTIGKSKVAVPKEYYKVILDYQEPERKAIGFLLPNEGSKKDLKSFATSVDHVEEVTGLDFFPKLPDPLEKQLERSYDVSQWQFEAFQASSADRAAYKAEPNMTKNTSKPSKLYTFASTTLRRVLFVVKHETVTIIELFVPKATLKEALPFLY
ncbi:MAG: DNA/RNA non-specific endonuclease [Sphaerochaeta sp.]|uniref:DNA/RNA non-specific endonuclease n=1 Tax=Sphaerochaeta sp. TaxID=1972642 RepID=UPI002FCC2524